MRLKILLKEFWSCEDTSKFIENFSKKNKILDVKVVPIPMLSCISKKVKYFVQIEYS